MQVRPAPDRDGRQGGRGGRTLDTMPEDAGRRSVRSMAGKTGAGSRNGKEEAATERASPGRRTQADVMSFIDGRNGNPRPCRRGRPADGILAPVRRFCLRMNESAASKAGSRTPVGSGMKGRSSGAVAIAGLGGPG